MSVYLKKLFYINILHSKPILFRVRFSSIIKVPYGYCYLYSKENLKIEFSYIKVI